MTDALRYRAVRKIADGGSAEVFLGEQVGAAGFRRDVVLKRIHPRLMVDERARQMLLDEAHLAMSLVHPNLVQVLDVGESAGASFLVLELVDGWTLGQVARRGGQAGLPIPPELSCYIAAEVCRGLEYAHARKRDGKPLDIVHRDVCPNNVLVSMHAEVKVADFGIARASSRTDTTRSGMIRGKPMYMSPEQALGQALDARSDLFSLGTVLYWLLTGELPFKGPGDQEFLAQIITTDAPSPSVVRPELPVELCRVVQKAMARDREQRFSSARELLTALEQVQRSVLAPAGRSELETWLRQLSALDKETPISRQTMPPAPNVSDSEWISLSAQHAVVDDQTETQRALPTFDPQLPRPSRWPLVAGALVLATLAVVAAVVFGDQGTAPPLPPEAQPVVLSDDDGPRADASVELVLAPVEDDAGALTVDVDAGMEVESIARLDDEEELLVDAGAEPGSRPVRGASTSVDGRWRLTARLETKQPAAPMTAVRLESVPPGLSVRVDKSVLGRTPVTLRFRRGLTYDVWFEGEGRPPLRRWLMLTERTDGSPRVTLRAPIDPP